MLLLKALRNFTYKCCKNSRSITNITPKNNVPDKVLSGIQPTGSVHLGNYLGAINQWVKLQDSCQDVILSIVDLHAMTLPFDPNELTRNILEVTATILACGVDPNKATLFQQSRVYQHTELWRYLWTVSTMPRLAHLPQFKTKSDTLQDVPLALYFYPVLQSADILLYKATHVPVGEDQLQHIQLCRELARMFNKRYGQIFPLPEAIISDEAISKIRSLRDPLKKMSKSDSNCDSRICLTDSSDDILHKIKTAVCNDNTKMPLELEGRPDISNLVFIHSMLSEKSVESICKEYEGLDILRYKLLLADCVIEHLTPIRTKLLDFIANPEYLISVLEDGAKKASKVATITVQEVYSKLGINYSNHRNISRQKNPNVTSGDKIMLGFEATGNIHLGNYLNTINECVQLQNLGKNIMLSIENSTTVCEPKVQKKNILETMATLLACGIDPSKSVLFQQSHIYHHNELCWHTTCIATMARLSQLPHIKDKFVNLEDVPVELFMHPLSQTVDILLYKATHVPAGGYQSEHLLLAQEIAKMFNQRYGLTFPIPQYVRANGAGISKIRSLKDPLKEMDNSNSNPKGIIYLTDSPDVIVKKIKGAVSDFNSKITYEPESRPGISNLVHIHSLLSEKSVDDICKECEMLDTLRYKLQLAEYVIEHLAPIRTKLIDLRGNPDYLLKVLEDGAEKASAIAQVTAEEVNFKLGLQLRNISSNKKKVVL